MVRAAFHYFGPKLQSMGHIRIKGDWKFWGVTQLLCLNCAHVTRESDTQFLNCVSKLFVRNGESTV